jgi:hypothetical protein
VIPPGQDIESLVIWGHYLAWAGHRPADTTDSSFPNLVEVRDLLTGANRVVAQSDSPAGETDWIRGSRDTVIYTDLAEVPSDEHPAVPWKIFALDLASGTKRLLAKSGSAQDETIAPLPEFDWPWVVWQQVNPGSTGGSKLVAFDLRDDSLHVKVATGNPSSVAIDQGTIFFDADSSFGKRDIFRVLADGLARPQAVTRSGRAALPVAANGSLVWEEPASDPSELWWLNSRTARPVRFARRAASAPGAPRAFVGDPFPGRDFVIWLDESVGRLLAAAPTGHGQPMALADSHLAIAARWWASGNRVVFATLDNPAASNPVMSIHLIELMNVGSPR